MPELTLPPLSPPALLPEGAALGVWRLRAALTAPDAKQAGHWYSARHALAADRNSLVLVLPRSADSAGVMLRFGDQVSDLAALTHPVLKVPCDSGITSGGQPYLVFDACEGQPLVRASVSLSLRERLQLIVDLCEALRYAHQQGWLLGAVDPSFLWLAADKRPQLMGMGLLRIPDPSEPFERGLTLASAPGFASPESAAGKAPSFAGEVFGVGVLACLLLDGRMPSDASGHELLPPASWPSLSALERFSLSALLRKAIAPQANRRYVGVEALAEDLRACLAGESHSALVLNPMPVTATVGAITGMVTGTIACESSLPAWPPRTSAARRVWWLSLALAALAVFAGMALLATGAAGK